MAINKLRGTTLKAAGLAAVAALLLSGARGLTANASELIKSANLPVGVTQLDTAPNADKALARADSASPATIVTSAIVAGEHLWVGRDGGVRRYNRHSGEWKFFPYIGSVCQGAGTSSVFSEPPHIWARLANTGVLCRLNPADSSWFAHDHWTVKTRTGPGGPVVFTPERLYIASQGSPDWQGVNIIDRKNGQWIKLLPTKPVAAMASDSRHLWLGVPAGILRINRVTEEYTYYQPNEYGGGATVNDIIPIPGGIAFATSGAQTGILGDEMRLTRNSFSVYIKKTKRWHTYQHDDREKLIRDIERGRIFYTFIKTPPGLVILKNGKWTLIDASNGLDSSDVITVDKDENHLYIGTSRGINVLDINTLKRKDVNLHIYRSLMVPRRLISDREYLWVFNHRGVFRVTKRNIFLSPQ